MITKNGVRYSRETKQILNDVLLSDPDIIYNCHMLQISFSSIAEKVEIILELLQKGKNVSLTKETLEGWIIYNFEVEHNSISIYGDGFEPINKI